MIGDFIMGVIYQLRCEKCDYKFEICAGYVGFCHWGITNKNKDKYLDKYFYDDLKIFFSKHPSGDIKHRINYLARCVDCGEYETVKGWLMRFDDKRIPILFKDSCHNCGGILELFYEDEITSRVFYCPNCNAELKVEFAGIWD